MFIDKSLFRDIAIATAILLVLFGVLLSVKPHWVSEYVWLVIAFYAFLSFASALGLNLALKSSDPYDFQNGFYAAKAGKMIITMAIIFIYAFFIKKDKFAFVGDLLVIYLLYTAFEIKFLLTNLRSRYQSGEKGTSPNQ